MPQSVGDRADQAVATERDGCLARGGRHSRELPGVDEAAGQLDVIVELQPGEGTPHAFEGPPRAAAAGRGIGDQRQLHGASVSAFRSSAIITGAGSSACSASRRVRDTRQDDRGVEPCRGCAGQVGIEAIADDQCPAWAEAVERRVEDLGIGLSDRARRALGRILERRHDRAGARSDSVAVGIGAIPAGSDHLGTGDHGLGGNTQLIEPELVVAGDDHDFRLGLGIGAVDDALPGIGDVTEDRLRSDHVGGRSGPALGQEMLDRGAYGHNFLERGPQSERPQLAHIVLGGAPSIVGEEHQPLAGRADLGDRVGRAACQGRLRPTRTHRGRGPHGRIDRSEGIGASVDPALGGQNRDVWASTGAARHSSPS